MQRITKVLKRTEDYGIFHDSRKDSRLFASMLNLCFEKINELQDEVEKLQQLNQQRHRLTIVAPDGFRDYALCELIGNSEQLENTNINTKQINTSFP